MSAKQAYDAEFRQIVLAALGDLLGSGVIGQRSRLRRLLRYLVTEELEGRGERVTAFSIGVDVFGRGEDFDPNSDSIVRVEVNRLRQHLAQYYAEAGADASLRIDLPPRTYRPVLSQPAPAAPVGADAGSATETTADEKPPSPGAADAAAPAALAAPRVARRHVVIAVVVAGLLGAAGAFATLKLIDRPQPEAAQAALADELPLVDVEPIAVNADDLAPLATSVREQLIANLTHLGTVRVRAPQAAAEPPSPPRPHGPDRYVVSGVLDRTSDGAVLALRLTGAGDGAVFWSRSIQVAATADAIEPEMLNAVGAASNELGGERGMVTMDALRRLNLRLAADPDSELSHYECLLLAYMYDSTKDPEAQNRARACLEQAVAAGSDSGAVWSQLALTLFLEWAQGTAPDTQLERALRAGRRAVQLAPYNAMAHEHLGSILSVTNDLEGAISEYRRAFALAPFKPSLKFNLGWQLALRDDWDGGIEMIRSAIETSPAPPGYMHIPIAIDAFRRRDYAESMRIGAEIAQLGDVRGLQLAFGAAVASGDLARARTLLNRLREMEGFDPIDPFRGVRNSFSSPEIMLEYDRAAWTSGLL